MIVVVLTIPYSSVGLLWISGDQLGFSWSFGTFTGGMRSVESVCTV